MLARGAQADELLSGGRLTAGYTSFVTGILLYVSSWIVAKRREPKAEPALNGERRQKA